MYPGIRPSLYHVYLSSLAVLFIVIGLIVLTLVAGTMKFSISHSRACFLVLAINCTIYCIWSPSWPQLYHFSYQEWFTGIPLLESIIDNRACTRVCKRVCNWAHNRDSVVS